MSAVTAPLHPDAPRASAAVAYQAASAVGGRPSAARGRPLMASSIAEVGPPRILVLEPDARTRSLLEVGLARAGFEVLAARNLAEAQEHLDVGRPLPAMLVCETDLEGEDGFRFCGQLRAEMRTASLPIVLLSQRPQAFHLEMASGAGADDYLPKPVFLNDVVALAKLKAGQSAAQAVFTADTELLPLGELMRALLAGMRSGRVELSDGSARLTFRQGHVVDAEVEGVRGARALTRLLLLARGPYTVTFGPALVRGTLSVDLRELCRSVLPDVLRSRKALERALPLEAVLRIDTPRLREVLPDLPDSVNGLVRLFDGKRTLRQVILKCELPESSALLVTTRLYGLGALEPVEVQAPAESLEQALAVAAESQAPGAAGGLTQVEPWSPDSAKSFPRLKKLDDFSERLDAALQLSTAAAAQAALAPKPARIVEVVLFEPKSREPQSLQEAVSLAAEAAAAPVAAPRPWWRGSQARVVSGALALFVASAALGAVLFRPAAAMVQGSSTAARVPRLPEWLTPHATGTAESWTALGLSRYDGGDLEGARDAAAQALALDPRHGQALLLLATIHYGQGQQVEAKAALRRYLAADPKGEFAAEARTLLGR